MRLIRGLVLLGLAVPALFVALVIGSMTLSPLCADLTGPPRDAAIILGEGLGDAPGGLSAGGHDRARAGVKLWREGAVERLIFSGSDRGRLPSVAEAMADWARSEGVPAAALATETMSDSTLENAQLSLPLLGPGDSFVVITEGYHLWRGWFSFWLAGDAPDAICQSSPMAARPDLPLSRRIGREVLAWGWNGLRGPIWAGARLAGLEARLPEGFLD